MQVRHFGAKGQSKWSPGNRLRRVQRATNQESRRLVRDEPALERESSSRTDQSNRKFKTSPKSGAEVRDIRRAWEVQRHYPESTESRDRRRRRRGGQGRKGLIHSSKRGRASEYRIYKNAHCLWCFWKSICKCPLTQRVSRNRPSTTEPALERADTK